MDVFDNHEDSSESSISLASSVFTHDPDFSPYGSYVVESDVPDDMDVDIDDGVQHQQHYDPPAYESLILENATVRSDADFFSVTGCTAATIGSSSVVSASETRCPTPGSVSASAPAADLQVQEPRPSDSSMTSPGPASHVVGRASDIPTSVDSMFNYGYAFVVQDDQGLCGIGAWADIATSPFAAKKKRITPRQ